MTGILITSPKGSAYWRPARTPEDGLRIVKEQLFLFAAAWDELTVDWGRKSDTLPERFQAERRLLGPGADYQPPAAGGKGGKWTKPLARPPRVGKKARASAPLEWE